MSRPCAARQRNRPDDDRGRGEVSERDGFTEEHRADEEDGRQFTCSGRSGAGRTDDGCGGGVDRHRDQRREGPDRDHPTERFERRRERLAG